MIATIVDVGALWKTIWHAAASGIVVSTIVGIAVRSYARSHDLRLADEPGRAGVHVAITLVACLATLAISAYGLYLITA